MKPIYLLCIFCIFSTYGCTQNSKTNAGRNDFEKFCIHVLNSYENEDIENANDLIDSETGVYTLSKNGAYTVYGHQDKFEKNRIYVGECFFNDKSYSIQYNKIPEYDPGEEKWKGNGIFIDTLNIYSPITKIVEFYENTMEEEKPASYKNKIKQIEKGCIKVLFADIDLLVYMKKINDKWCIIIVDEASNDYGC